jgi:outer membrane protein
MQLPGSRHCRQATLLAAILALSSSALAAQTAPPSAWTLRTRAYISGGSHASDPAGYKAYSSLGLEGQLDRQLGRSLGVSLTRRTESREVDSLPRQGPSRRLGSVELFPMSLLLNYRLDRGALQPYLGVGGTLTVAWEKSGVLDSLDVKAALGPALQAGFDVPISRRGVFNFDVRWNTHRLRVFAAGSRLFTIKVDPLTLGAGIGLKF